MKKLIHYFNALYLRINASGWHNRFLYIKLALVFVFTLTLMALYSYKKVPYKIYNIEIIQSGIKEAITPSVHPIAMAAVNRREKPKTETMDSTKQKFLLIGDSMLEGLGYRLNDYCRQNGHTMNSVIYYSSSTLWYGNCDTLAYFVQKFNPSYIIIVLGANELFIRDVYSRDVYVKHILEQVGKRKFLWVGPPNWKEDTGINNLIARNTGYKCYFPSKNMTFERSRDGAHPTRASAVVWMDSIAAFIVNKSKYPVLMNIPADSIRRKSPPTTLLMPNAPPNM